MPRTPDAIFFSPFSFSHMAQEQGRAAALPETLPSDNSPPFVPISPHSRFHPFNNSIYSISSFRSHSIRHRGASPLFTHVICNSMVVTLPPTVRVENKDKDRDRDKDRDKPRGKKPKTRADTRSAAKAKGTARAPQDPSSSVAVIPLTPATSFTLVIPLPTITSTPSFEQSQQTPFSQLATPSQPTQPYLPHLHLPSPASPQIGFPQVAEQQLRDFPAPVEYTLDIEPDGNQGVRPVMDQSWVCGPLLQPPNLRGYGAINCTEYNGPY